MNPQNLSDYGNFFVVIIAGLFTGSFVTLFTVYAILAHISGMFSPRSEKNYMETVYPVFRYTLSHYLRDLHFLLMLFVHLHSQRGQCLLCNCHHLNVTCYDR